MQISRVSLPRREMVSLLLDRRTWIDNYRIQIKYWLIERKRYRPDCPKKPTDEDITEDEDREPERYWKDPWLSNEFIVRLQKFFVQAANVFDKYYYVSGKRKTRKDNKWGKPVYPKKVSS